MPASVERTVEQRIVEAGAVLPSGGAVTGWAALRWMGARWLDGRDHDGGERPVILASCAQDVAPQPGFVPCEERLNPEEVITVDGLRVAVPARAVFFEMRYADTFADAVIAFDMAAFADLVSLHEAEAYVVAHPGWTGVPRARKVLAACDENSWSPWETRLRLVWERTTGLPRPQTNRPVFGLDGRYVGTPDLIDAEHGVIGQYEGAVHLRVDQRTSDVRRDHRYREVGLEDVLAYSVDIADQHHFRIRLLDTYARAARRSEERRWTLDAPPGWQPTHTVEQRRALTGRARDAVLRRRARLSA